MTKVGENYVVPLPFQNESLEMPNDRRQAVKRLMYLMVRFKRDPSYLADYKKFMDDLITKGYARKQDTRPPGLFHTMGCITQASLGKPEWSLTAVQSLINDSRIKNG